MGDFLALAFRVAADTVAYLMAWWGLPVWALLAAVLLPWWARGRPVEEWATSGSPARRVTGAFLLAIARPRGRPRLEENLALLEGRTGGTAVHLAAAHGLTLYHLFLLGPLLGKDVLLSHLIGGAAFAAFTAVAAGALRAGRGTASDGPAGGAPPRPRGPVASGGEAGGPAPSGDRDTSPRRPGGEAGEAGEAGPGGLLGLGLGELARFGGTAAWGLAVGALIGAAGLSNPSLLLTELPLGDGLVRQSAHAGLGLAAAVLTFMWPVSTLFAGTYLWKVGLAHAGLVAFFYGAAVAPQRIRAYRRVRGTARALEWTAALATAAVLAGLLTAVLFGLTDLGIRYKLVPDQLWRP